MYVNPTQSIWGLWSSTKHDRAETPNLLFLAYPRFFVGHGDKLVPGFSDLQISDLNRELRAAAVGLPEARQNAIATSRLFRGMDQPKIGWSTRSTRRKASFPFGNSPLSQPSKNWWKSSISSVHALSGDPEELTELLVSGSLIVGLYLGLELNYEPVPQ